MWKHNTGSAQWGWLSDACSDICMREMYQIILRPNGTAEDNWCALKSTEISSVGSLSLLHRAFSHVHTKTVFVFFPILQMQRPKSRKVTSPRFPLICQLPFTLPLKFNCLWATATRLAFFCCWYVFPERSTEGVGGWAIFCKYGFHVLGLVLYFYHALSEVSDR